MPAIETGTMGAPASIAMVKPPRLNGWRRPSELRVPSAKMANETPSSQLLYGELDAGGRRIAVRAVDRNESGGAHSGGQDRNAHEFLLDEYRDALRNRRNESQRVNIGNMIGDEDAGAGGNVFKPFDMDANAEDSVPHPHSLHGERVHQVRTPGDDAPENQPGESEEDAQAEVQSEKNRANHGREALVRRATK